MMGVVYEIKTIMIFHTIYGMQKKFVFDLSYLTFIVKFECIQTVCADIIFMTVYG